VKPNADKPAAKDDLKTLPMLELQAKLGVVAGRPQSSRSAERLTQYGPNEIEEKKTNAVPEIPQLFLGSNPMDDRSSV